MVTIDISSSYPTTDEVYIHELNKNGSKKIEIAFIDDSVPLDLSGKTVTATFVTNGILIVEDVELTAKDGTTNAFILDVSSNDNYTLIPGKMLVEFKIAGNDEELYPAVAMIIKVVASIRNNAIVTPESYGTVTEILKEIAKARGAYNKLGERLDEYDEILPITTKKIQNEAVTSEKIGSGEVKTANIDSRAVTGAKIAVGTITGENIGVGQITAAQIDNGEVTTDKLKNAAVTAAKIADNAIVANKIHINSITNDKLADNTVNTNKIADEAVTTVKIYDGAVTEKKLASEAVTNEKLSENSVLGKNIQNGAINFLKLASALVAVSGDSGQAWAFANDTTIPTTALAKAWINNVGDNRIVKPSVCIGIDTAGCVNHVGTIGQIAGALYIYVDSSTTAIPDRVLLMNEDLHILYVDNDAADVTLESELRQEIEDGNITVYYKGEFNLVELLVRSQQALNSRLTALESKNTAT